ncbi:MAG: hypothetical protein U1G07_25995 [Verrucomicrobiota bacterium]
MTRTKPTRNCLRIDSTRSGTGGIGALGRLGLATLVVAASVSGSCLRGQALSGEAPQLDLIELFGTNQVTIHFNTAANKTYTLQAVDCLLCAGSGVDGSANLWTNVFVAPNLPFSNHYVIVDTRSNPLRLYRLMVTD